MKLLFSYQSTHPSAEKVTLSLLFGQHMAAYLWVDAVSQQAQRGAFYQLAHWEKESFIEEFLKECLLDNKAPVSVQISFDAPHITQIPVVQYDHSKLELLHKAAYPYSPHMLCLHESYASWQFYLGYAVPENLFRTLESRFSDLKYYHAIKWLLKDSHATNDAGAFLVQVGIAQLSIALCRNGRLLFTGYFNYQHEMDAVYYLLQLTTKHNLSTSTVQLSLAGLIDPTSRLYEELSNYFQLIQTAESSIQFSEAAPPSHYFMLLSNNPVCVS